VFGLDRKGGLVLLIAGLIVGMPGCDGPEGDIDAGVLESESESEPELSGEHTLAPDELDELDPDEPGEMSDIDGLAGGADPDVEPIICGSENWNSLSYFQSNSTYRIGSQYGKAIGQGVGCSVALYSADKFLTADHCGGGEGTFTFGLYPGSQADALNRLRDLGASPSAIQYASAYPDKLSKFTCYFYETYDWSGSGGYDVARWTCSWNNIPGFGYIGPGDIWGYVETAPGNRSEGTDVYVVGYNDASYLSPQLLLSPGGDVEDSVDSCVATEPYDRCFEHDGDTLGGSSGGPIFDRGTHRVFGLVHGHYDADTIGQNDCGTILATNYGGYLPAKSNYEHTPLTPNPLPGSGYEFSNYVGGQGGSASFALCPEDYLAAGVVGTTYPWDPVNDGRVGNFGLVCVPHMTLAASFGQSMREVESWLVAVGGSYDTTIGGGTFPFNEYIHEELDLYQDGGALNPFSEQQQSLTMCAPGEYITGIKVREGSTINSIIELQCSKPGLTGGGIRAPRVPIGTRSSGSIDTTLCPDVNGNPSTAAWGLYVKSGWLTDGFRLVCREF
jgi:V8-like Glu-specific endopeptidase